MVKNKNKKTMTKGRSLVTNYLKKVLTTLFTLQYRFTDFLIN